MGSIRKVGKKFRVEVRHGNFYRSGNFDLRTEAKAADARWEAEYQIKGSQGFEPHALGEALVRYANEISPTKKGERWEIIRAKAILKNYPELCAKMMHTITLDDMEAWRESRLRTRTSGSATATGTATVRREMIYLSAVWETAYKTWKWTDKNLIQEMRREKSNPSRTRRISNDEIDLILAQLNKNTGRPAVKKRALARMFLLAIESAMRLGELCSIAPEHVHLSKKIIHLPDTKNGDRRDVPLSPAGLKIVEEQLSIEPAASETLFGLNVDVASAMFRKAVRDAGIRELTFHDTRHEAITRLAKKVDPLTLGKIVGHRNIQHLMIYYNPTATEIAEMLV